MSTHPPLSNPIRFLLLFSVLVTGCNRAYYRERADQEVACMIAQKSTDPRWALPGFNINVDQRSRYFDPYDPDATPMPPDDPESHKFMHCVDGKRGWSKWHQFGDRPDLENPDWQLRLGEYAPMNDEGEVILTLDTALQIAYINSPSYQDTLEELYLSALDVTTERFRFQTQFFGGTDTTFRHLGRLRGGETNGLAQDTDFELRKRFATAGELVVGFANQFVWQFAGTDSSSALSLLNFSLVQPLLRGAGRDIALETLTIVERALLANLRAFAQYRQGFYTGIAIGDASVSGPRRRGGFFGGTGLSGFTGQGSGGFGGVGAAGGFGRQGFGGGGGAGATGGGFAGGGAASVGGFLGLLQTTQEIRNSRTSLNLQLRTLGLLESSLDAGVIDLTQVDQFRQSIETQKATLLQAENGLRDTLESFKITALGLPPDVPISLDDDFIEPFQLIDASTNKLQDDINDQQLSLGEMTDPDIQSIQRVLQDAAQLEADFKQSFATVDQNLSALDEATDQREADRTPEEVNAFRRDKTELAEDLQELSSRFSQLQEQRGEIERNAGPGRQTTDQMVIWLRNMLGVAQELSLVQARAKLEAVAVEAIDIDADRAFQIALQHRFDIMNNRASLVDTWRLIQFNADALQSNLDVFIEGDMQTVGDNALKFRSTASTVRAGLRFDAPFTRLVERNNYRQQLIEYQRARRDLIQTYDGIYFGLRSRLRNLEQLRINLEIQRRATVIAIRRVDLTRETLNEPQPPAQPGQPASTLGPTAAQNLLTALSDLRNTQNNFLSVYLSYYANRMLLARDLGTMQLDEMGRWTDGPLEGFEFDMTDCLYVGQDSLEEPMPLVPPALSNEMQEFIDPEGDLVTENEVMQAPVQISGPVSSIAIERQQQLGLTVNEDAPIITVDDEVKQQDSAFQTDTVMESEETIPVEGEQSPYRTKYLQLEQPAIGPSETKLEFKPGSVKPEADVLLESARTETAGEAATSKVAAKSSETKGQTASGSNVTVNVELSNSKQGDSVRVAKRTTLGRMPVSRKPAEMRTKEAPVVSGQAQQTGTANRQALVKRHAAAGPRSIRVGTSTSKPSHRNRSRRAVVKRFQNLDRPASSTATRR